MAGSAFIHLLETHFFNGIPVILFKQDLVDQGKALKLTLQLITRYDQGNDCRKVHGLLITHLTMITRSRLARFPTLA